MADDMFTAEIEWLLRMRRQRTHVHRLALRARRFVRDAGSSQPERDIRRWKTVEAERLDEDLSALVDFLADMSMDQTRGLV